MSQQIVSEPERDQRPPASPLTAVWAQGDFAVHPLAMVTPLIDGRDAMLAMCVAFLQARKSIWIVDWSIYARLQLVRGHDQRAGQDGSDAQYALIDRLRAAGLENDAIALWQAAGLSLVDVLARAVRRGVVVRVLLWDPLDPFNVGHLGNDPTEQAEILARQGVPCRLDKNCRSALHIAQGLHQKCAVVDAEVAFVGGIDFTVEYSGDFDRWDMSTHPFELDLRSTEKGASPHPWHDAQVMFTGPAVLDVERNIRERWDASAGKVQQRIQPFGARIRGIREVIERERRPHAVTTPPASSQPAEAIATTEAAAKAGSIQVIRTIPALTYRFAPGGIYGIAQWYQRAIQQARRFIYLESQYLWVEGPPKLNFTRVGWESRTMRAVVEELAAAAERGAHIALVLPDHPNVGRAVTDETIDWLCQHAPHATAANRLHFYTLATCSRASDGGMRYRPVYVHAKVAIIDDRWAAVGSANLNSRGMSHDAELNVAIEHVAFARGLRQTLWAEHTATQPPANVVWPVGPSGANQRSAETPGTAMVTRALALVQTMPGAHETNHAAGCTAQATPDTQLIDPVAGLGQLARIADENLRRLRQGEPLAGHLLPYLRSSESATSELHIERHRGLLDPLREIHEGIVVPHYNRYM